MTLSATCLSHSGADPVWHWPPSDRMIRTIKSLTRSREDTGRRFYVTLEGWAPLRTAADFAALNAILDENRNT